MLLNDLGPQIHVTETLRKVDGRWALVSKHNPKKVLQYYHGDGHPSEEWVKKVERRVHSFSESIIVEGGNVFKDSKTKEPLTGRINQADVPRTIDWLETITHIPHLENALGTTGKKPTSGDLDIGIEPGSITKEELIGRLTTWCNQTGVDPAMYIKKSGISVHFLTAINGHPDHGFVQTDFMFVPSLNFAKWAMTADPTSEYKDANKHVVLSSIAKAQGYKWSPTTGLLDRATNKLITDNPNQVAELLLGPQNTAGNIAGVEKIVAALDRNPNKDALLADARATLGKDGIEI